MKRTQKGPKRPSFLPLFLRLLRVFFRKKALFQGLAGYPPLFKRDPFFHTDSKKRVFPDYVGAFYRKEGWSLFFGYLLVFGYPLSPHRLEEKGLKRTPPLLNL